MSEKDQTSRETLKIYGRALWNHKPDMLISLLQPLGWVFMIVAVPFYASKCLADIAQQTGKFEYHLTLLIVASALGFISNRLGFNALMSSQAKVLSDLHQVVFTKLLQRGLKFHTNNIGGKLVSDALDFVGAFGLLHSTIFGMGFSLASTLVIGLIVITVQSWQLGLFIFVMVVISLAWAYLESRKRHSLRLERLVATKQVTAHLSDSIVNAPTVKTFANETVEQNVNKALNHTLRQMRIRDWQRAGRSGSNRIAFLLFMLVLLLVLVHSLSTNNATTLSAGIFAFTYTLNLIIRLFDINAITRQIEEAFLQASPMTRILLEPNEVQDLPNASVLNVSHGEIVFDNIQFHYREGKHHQGVFSGLHIAIKPGEKVGLVGPSGGGKTTLSRLLLRFEDVQKGAITIDGQNIQEVTQTSLRSMISYVPQEPLLFHRSIKENVAYGKPGATDTEVKAATKLANADTFIDTLPERYGTVVGERGVKLSGGQRQRIAIARAILKNAPILVLDEATSALDSESEDLIQKAMWQLMDKRTAIVIAHRLSTIQKMDRILVLDNGAVVEEGTHADLLKHDGLYAKLWARQSGGFLDN